MAGPAGLATYRDVGCEAGDERGGDGVGDGGVGTLGLLSCGGDDVKANKGIETRRRPLHDLQCQRQTNVDEDTEDAHI